MEEGGKSQNIFLSVFVFLVKLKSDNAQSIVTVLNDPGQLHKIHNLFLVRFQIYSQSMNRPRTLVFAQGCKLSTLWWPLEDLLELLFSPLLQATTEKPQHHRVNTAYSTKDEQEATQPPFYKNEL